VLLSVNLAMPYQMTSLHFFVAVAAMNLPWVAANISTAVRRSSSAQNSVLPAMAPLLGPLAVPLKKVASPVLPEVSFFVGHVSVGQPRQDLQVLFDTSSGHVILPHRACKSKACVEHHRYSPWQSTTAMDVNKDGVQLDEHRRLVKGKVHRDVGSVGFTQSDLGEGNASSVLVRDSICLNGYDKDSACVDMSLMAAIRLDDKPFAAMPNDGIVGLAMEGLSVDPLTSFLGRLA
jgi:ribosomal protein L32